MRKILLTLLVFTLCLACTNKRTVNNENAMPIIAEAEIMPEITTAYASPSRGLNLRSEPAATSTRIMHLPQNTELTILERSEQRERIDGLFDYWYKVDTGEETGWVYGGYISSVPRSHSVELKKVNEYEWDRSKDNYALSLIDNQVLCFDTQWVENSHRVDYYIKDYLTGEITHRFEEPIKLWGGYGGSSLMDQYGQYLFLDKDDTIVLFDVQEKREITLGEPIKRPEYVYYTEERRRPSGRGETPHLIKYNLTTGQSTEVNIGSFISLSMATGYYRTLKDIGNNQLLLYDDYREYILQLNDSMTEVLNINERKITHIDTFQIVGIKNSKYISFLDMRDVLIGDADSIDRFSIVLLDEMGNIYNEYKDIIITVSNSYSSVDMSNRCIVSPDSQYVMFFDIFGHGMNKVYVYQILYD